MTMERTAWLFTRDQESVRIELRTTSRGVQLAIEGPGAARSSYDFPVGTAVDGFRRAYEEKLLANGYRLQVVSERRGDVSKKGEGGDRRQS